MSALRYLTNKTIWQSIVLASVMTSTACGGDLADTESPTVDTLACVPPGETRVVQAIPDSVPDFIASDGKTLYVGLMTMGPPASGAILVIEFGSGAETMIANRRIDSPMLIGPGGALAFMTETDVMIRDPAGGATSSVWQGQGAVRPVELFANQDRVAFVTRDTTLPRRTRAASLWTWRRGSSRAERGPDVSCCTRRIVSDGTKYFGFDSSEGGDNAIVAIAEGGERQILQQIPKGTTARLIGADEEAIYYAPSDAPNSLVAISKKDGAERRRFADLPSGLIAGSASDASHFYWVTNGLPQRLARLAKTTGFLEILDPGFVGPTPVGLDDCNVYYNVFVDGTSVTRARGK